MIAAWTTNDSEMYACIRVEESRLPESPRPWFQIETGGIVYQGQATKPPTQDEHGCVVFELTLTRLQPTE